jgi:hypothetical protein
MKETRHTQSGSLFVGLLPAEAREQPCPKMPQANAKAAITKQKMAVFMQPPIS